MLQLTKNKIAQLVQDVEDGEESPLKAYAIIKDLASLLKQAENQIKDGAIIEAEKYGEKSFSDYGFEFEVRNGRRYWNYKNCESWNEADKKKKEVEDKLKAAYRAYEKNLIGVDEETGEVSEIPEVNYSSPSIIVKEKH